MTSQRSRDWGLPVPNDDPVYVELRERVERLLWSHGKQALDAKIMDIGEYHLGMFTGDGDPNLVSVEIRSPPPTRARWSILNDNNGKFDKGRCEKCLVVLRTRMVLDDLADI